MNKVLNIGDTYIDIPAKYIDYNFFESLQTNGTLKNTIKTLNIRTLSKELNIDMDILDISSYTKTEHKFIFTLGKDAQNGYQSHDNCKLYIYDMGEENIAFFGDNVDDYVSDEGISNPNTLIEIPSKEVFYGYDEYAVYECDIQNRTILRRYYAKECKISEFIKIFPENKELVTLTQLQCKITPEDLKLSKIFNRICIYSSLFLKTMTNVPTSIPYDAGPQKSGYHINAIPIFDISFENIDKSRIDKPTTIILNVIKNRKNIPLP